MDKPRPENLELGSLQPALHLVHSEPTLVSVGATTPTIKLSAYEYGSGGGSERNSVGKILSSPVVLSAVQQGRENKLGLTNSLQGRENSDLSPTDQNGNTGKYALWE